MESLAHILNQPALRGSKQVITLFIVAVFTLACIAGYGDDSLGAILGSVTDERGVKVGLFGLFVTEEPVFPTGRVGFAQLKIFIGDILAVILVQTWVDRHIGVGQSLNHVDGIRLVDISRTKSVGIEIIRTDTKERHFLVFGQRQGGTSIFEQHYSFLRCLTCHFCMCFQIRIPSGLMTLETLGLQDIAQHPAYTFVHIGLGEGTVFHSLHNIFYLLGLAAHEQVVAGMYLIDRNTGLAPVGHHHASESPLATKQVGEQPSVALHALPVQAVIRRHDSPWVGLSDGYLKIAQIDLAQGPLGNACIVEHTHRLLAIGCKVLDGASHTLRLQSSDDGGRHVTRQQGVFGVVFKIAPIERIALDVETGCQQHVDAVRVEFLTHRSTHLSYQFVIPSRGQQRGHREACTVILARISLSHGINTQSRRAILKIGMRNAQSAYGTGRSRHIGHQTTAFFY